MNAWDASYESGAGDAVGLATEASSVIVGDREGVFAPVLPLGSRDGLPMSAGVRVTASTPPAVGSAPAPISAVVHGTGALADGGSGEKGGNA